MPERKKGVACVQYKGVIKKTCLITNKYVCLLKIININDNIRTLIVSGGRSGRK